MRATNSKLTAILTAVMLTGTMTACGGMGGPASDMPGADLDLSTAPETVAAENSTSDGNTPGTAAENNAADANAPETAAENSTAEGDLPQITVPEISIPDGSIPDVTISDIHIDLPDTSVPDIYEYFPEYANPSETRSQETAANQSAGVQTITDLSGDFTYTGELYQGGDDDNGYILVPANFVSFKDVDVDGLTQYSDTTGKNIITLKHYKDLDYKTAANNIRSHLETEENLNDLKGATLTVAGYNALQLYGHYSDGYYSVIWLIEDPANPTGSTYYLAMEFDTEHQNIIACSSTFQTVEDHNS